MLMPFGILKFNEIFKNRELMTSQKELGRILSSWHRRSHMTKIGCSTQPSSQLPHPNTPVVLADNFLPNIFHLKCLFRPASKYTTCSPHRFIYKSHLKEAQYWSALLVLHSELEQIVLCIFLNVKRSRGKQ